MDAYMQSVTVMINETPYCVWDWELDKLDRDFINGIDPSYFEHMIEAHVPLLDGDHAHQAALAIRMSYSHAMETLMSLLCALVQSPDCVIGWLHKYQNNELEAVVGKLDRGETVHTKLKTADLSWMGLSKLVHKFVSHPDTDKTKRIIEEYGRFWARIAQEFLDEGGRKEYNSIKHGLRAQSGGFTLMIGMEATPGVAPPHDQMKPSGGSRFGSTYYTPQPIDGLEKPFQKCNIKITSTSRNWLPESLAHRIDLMSLSMMNILSFLKVMYDNDPEKHQFVWPEDWERSQSAGSTRLGH